jgi:asparagine synthase (glutamine-hydrolysing)
MCGLAGYLDYNQRPASVDTLTPMTRAIAHRGPDGSGHLVENNLALGHRRLSIIDLSESANQPLTTPSGRWSIVYNGEIYNFQQLRADLEAVGEIFSTTSDSEVLLRALEVWGLGAVERLNGMFAFAALDRREQMLHFARDRFGVKPLYYMATKNGLLFGSEIKAILAHPFAEKAINKKGVAEYCTFMNFISDETLFKDIFLFPAGSTASIHLDRGLEPGSRLDSTQFWDFEFTGKGTVDAGEKSTYIEELRAAFENAVSRQLISDVGVSSYLSGGIDSGAITAVAAAKTGRMRTFTCAFDTHGAGSDKIFDERDAAEFLSRHCLTEQYEIVLKHSDFERSFTKLIHHLEEPRVGQSYPNFMVAGLASRFEKVCLSGAGGDELFGGYPWRYFNGLPKDGSAPESFESFADGYYNGTWRRLARTDDQLTELLRPIGLDTKDYCPRDTFMSIFPKHAFGPCDREDALNWALYFEAKTFLNGLLIVEDKVSMAHSLETRVPFLDNDLVELACRTPIGLKLDISNPAPAPGQRRSDGKLILREMLKTFVPEDTAKRDKQGFSAPDASWFRNQSRGFVTSRLLDRSRPLFDYLDFDAVSSTVNTHLSGDQDHRIMIWAFMHLDEMFASDGLTGG